MAILAAAGIVIAIFLGAIGQGAGALAVGVLVLLVLAAGALDAMVARGQIARHGGDVAATEDDETETVPTLLSDAETPVGASADSHTDVSPHDLPPDHPGRRRVEEEARRERAGAAQRGR
jgi:hypothetical protein